MKVTIKDIAKMAGVSIGTVSRVLNNKPKGVSEQKRQQIQGIIEEYNYTPNTIARSLVTNKTKEIGVLIPDVLNPAFQMVARAIEDYAIEVGYDVFICNADYDKERYLNYIKKMVGKNVDGIILVGYPGSKEKEIKSTIKNNKVVAIGKKLQVKNCIQITTEPNKCVYEIIKYIIEQGHKKIAYIGEGDRNISQNRLEAYKKALKEYDIPYEDHLVCRDAYKFEDGIESAAYIMEHTDATAIFCFSDVLAQGVYKYCRDNNKSIPEHISVVGFDNIYTAELMLPPLTTVEQPSYEIGAEAAKQLIRWIEDEVLQSKKILFSNNIIIRDSVKKIL